MPMPEPTVWTVTYPPEPGPEVTKVRDGEDDLWVRDEVDWACPSMGTGRTPWHELFVYGDTVTDASHELEEAPDA